MSQHPQFNIYSPENIEAHLKAMQIYFDSMQDKREFRTLGRGFDYPFGQNQAEWERSIFIRGWYACLDWVRKELANEEH